MLVLYNDTSSCTSWTKIVKLFFYVLNLKFIFASSVIFESYYRFYLEKNLPDKTTGSVRSKTKHSILQVLRGVLSQTLDYSFRW